MAEEKPRSLPPLPDNQIFYNSTPKNPRVRRKQRIRSRDSSTDKDPDVYEAGDSVHVKSFSFDEDSGASELVANLHPTSSTSKDHQELINISQFDPRARGRARITRGGASEIVSPVWGSRSSNNSTSGTPNSTKSKLMQVTHSSLDSESSFDSKPRVKATTVSHDIKGTTTPPQFEDEDNELNNITPISSPNQSDRKYKSDRISYGNNENNQEQSGTNPTDAVSSDRPQKHKQKSRRKKDTSAAGAELRTELFDNDIDMTNLEGDISVVSKHSSAYPFSLSVDNQKSVSQPVGKCFVEQQRGFLAVDNTQPLSAHLQSSSPAPSLSNGKSAVDLARKSQKHFHTFCIFCHGLLAGIALWQIILVYNLGPPKFSALDFIEHYSTLSNPLQTCFYILLVICTVSVFDRYDIGRPQWSFVQGLISCRTGALTVFIYPATLFLSLSIKDIDDKLGLYHYNATMWEIRESKDVTSEVEQWMAMNLARCIGAILGWIIVSLQPPTDHFLDHLEIIVMQHNSGK